MIDAAFVRTMARYNTWQNDNIYAAAETLSAAERSAGRGAFFGSIHGTLSHLLWGDQMWMSRFSTCPKPDVGIGESASYVRDWAELVRRRHALDAEIQTWADGLTSEWLSGNLEWYSGAAQKHLRHERALLVAHFFNHQTHHRGQVHAMLTAAGAKPGDTDLMLLDA
ncbi:MAG: damage-inducible protein DinB [Alphaproteobacteria bacterium]|nr:damage-inducible protein DinB [Alphaproteobacteria bacterium]MBO6861837.1 damage-inducible protein DinB [Alphaproteobacteria bacterium]